MRTKQMFAAALLALTTFSVPAAMLAQGPPPPGYRPGYGNDPWRTPPREYDAIRRQGFQDGMYGAQKDVENHRRPNPNNRDEYRRPSVAPRDRSAYREGFRQGYNVAMQHMLRR